LVTVPATVTIPAGSTLVNFSIATSRTPVVVNAKVTATKGSVVLTGTLPVLPIGLDLSSPWAKFHGDAANTGYSPNGVTSPDWSATIGSPVLSSPAIGLDGTIYVGANNGYLYALKGTDGSVLWKYKTGGRIASSPVVTKNGVVFVGSADKSVYAINGTNGAKLWSYKTGGAVTSTPCIGADGSLYVGSYDGYLYALAQTSGTKLWSFQTGGPVVSSPNISSIGILYVGSNDNCLYAIDTLSRTKLWSYTTGGDVQSSPALANGNVYFGSFDGNVYALSQTTGAKVWNFQTDWVVYSSPSVDSAGNVFVGSDDASIYSLNGATGALNWSYLTNDCVGSTPAIDLSGNLYVGSDDGNLYCLNAAGGSLIQAAPQNGAVESSPAITAGAAIAGVNSIQGVVVRSELNIAGLLTTNWSTANGYLGLNSSKTAFQAFNLKSKISTTADVIAGVIHDASNNHIFGASDKTVYCFNDYSKLLWSFGSNGSITGIPSVASTNDIYFSTDNGYAYCISSTGNLRWVALLSGRLYCSPAISKGVVLFAADGSYCWGLDAKTGKILWKKSIDGSYSCLTAPDGNFLLSSNGVIKLDPKTGTTIWSNRYLQSGCNAILSDGTIIWSAWAGNQSFVGLMTASGVAQSSIALPGCPGISVSPDQQFIVVALDNGSIKLLSAKTLAILDEANEAEPLGTPCVDVNNNVVYRSKTKIFLRTIVGGKFSSAKTLSLAIGNFGPISTDRQGVVYTTSVTNGGSQVYAIGN
jgi:outer membrane protein assembly factor BamB